jgi:hypothetical protein
MNKKILVACNDPGGTMACLPVIKRLVSDINVSTSIYAGGSAQNILGSEHIPFNTFPKNYIYKKDLCKIEAILNKEKPDLVFTSTSFGKVIDNAILFTAVKKNIKTLALLDQWCNYSQRFKIYAPNKNYEYLPSFIGVMDEFAKNEMIKECFPPDRLIIMGHPYFDSILMRKKSFSAEEKSHFKKEYNISRSDIVVIFAAEPFRREDLKIIGYTDIKIVKHLRRALESISRETEKKATLLIKIHPRDKRHDAAFPVTRGNNIHIILVRRGQATKFILNADIVAGMSSIFLLESFLLGKPTLSIQIGRKIEDDLITNKIGLTKPIKSYQELHNTLIQIVAGDSKVELKKANKDFPWLDGKSTERVLSFINKML